MTALSQSFTVDDCSSEFLQNIILEFNTRVETLVPLQPFIHVADDSGITYHVQSFARVYTQTMGNTTTKLYLAELKGLAKISGRVHAEVLKDMTSRHDLPPSVMMHLPLSSLYGCSYGLIMACVAQHLSGW